MNVVAVNGEIVPRDAVRLPLDERGFLYGESVFTTLRCYHGTPFRLVDHCARINATLTSPVFDLDFQLASVAVRKTVAALIEKNKCPSAMVRIMVTRGRGAGPNPPATASPLVIITVTALAEVDASLDTRGVRLAVSSITRDARGWLGRHKLGNYIENLVARREARAAGCDEGIICEPNGYYLECACANLFAVSGDELLTPGTNENILPGIARQTVIECAAAVGIPVRYGSFAPAFAADEVFMTNCRREIVPVRQIAEREFSVAPGGITQRLLQLYRERVAHECE